MCKMLGVLPRAGGLLDQDSYLVYGMNLVLLSFREAEKKAQDEAARRKR